MFGAYLVKANVIYADNLVARLWNARKYFPISARLLRRKDESQLSCKLLAKSITKDSTYRPSWVVRPASKRSALNVVEFVRNESFVQIFSAE